MEKGKEKQGLNQGITLIALVITIIVLLILAGISIATLTGEGGILNKATGAKEKSQKETIIEQARLDIFEKQTEHLGSLTEKEFKTILENYGTLSNHGEATIFDKVLKTKEGSYDIGVREIWEGTLAKAKVNFRISGENDSNFPEKNIYFGEYTVEEGTTWIGFFEKEFSEKKYGYKTGNWHIYLGNNIIFILENYSTTTGYYGWTLLDKEGEKVTADSKIGEGEYSINRQLEFIGE